MSGVISSALPSIVVLPGSSRSGSYNMALARIARKLVEDAGGKANLGELAAHLPEAGTPKGWTQAIA